LLCREPSRVEFNMLCFSSLFFFLLMLGIEPRASHMPASASTAELHPSPPCFFDHKTSCGSCIWQQVRNAVSTLLESYFQTSLLFLGCTTKVLPPRAIYTHGYLKKKKKSPDNLFGTRIKISWQLWKVVRSLSWYFWLVVQLICDKFPDVSFIWDWGFLGFRIWSLGICYLLYHTLA
jgi:hypothetical protein